MSEYLQVGLIAVALLILVYWLLGRLNARSARQLYDHAKSLYSGLDEYALATPDDFGWLDIEYYDRSQQELQSLGFRHLADIEVLTATKASPKMRTFLRCLVNHEGSIQAAVYHIRVSGWMTVLTWLRFFPKNMYIVDLETEFEDGTFLVTTACHRQLPECPGIDQLVVPSGTHVRALLDFHRDRLKQAINRDPDARIRFVSTLVEALEAQDRMQMLKSDHRKRVGYVTQDDIEKAAGGEFSRAVTRELIDEIESIRREDVPLESQQDFFADEEQR